MRFFGLGAALGACAAVALWSAAMAQMPAPSSPEAAEIATCLCLQRSVDTLGATMAERQRVFEASRQEVAALDAQLQNARATLNVDNPEAVAQFRQLLERRDAAFHQSSGTLFSQYYSTVRLYNDRIGEFNTRCSNRPRNPILVSQVQATLVCPGP